MNKREKLVKLKEKMNKDASLPLRSGATNLVFGEGSPEAKLMFIGEGPGFWEDQKGRPFVGKSGAFLNQLLSSIGLKRRNVFITNIICFRPPENRDPALEEIAAFQPYLDKMIEIIEPEVIVTLGRFSLAKFIPGVYISSVHGQPRLVDWNAREIKVVPMYHPAAGLRNPEIKNSMVEDFQKLLKVIKKPEEKNPSDTVVIKEERGEDKKVEQMSLV